MRTYARVRRFRNSVLRAGDDYRRSPSEIARAASDVIALSRFFYLFVAFDIGTLFLGFHWAHQGTSISAPLWPVEVLERLTGTAWLAHTRTITMVGIVFAMAAAAFPGRIVWRLGIFLYVLLQVSLANSYGSINHGQHVMLFVSFALLFLPRCSAAEHLSRREVLSCLRVLWMAQALVLLPYSLAGFWKLWYGRFEIFSPDAMVRILTDRALAEVDSIPVLLPFVVQHNWLAQSMFWLVLYLEIFALLVVFRPQLHRLFGAALMLFHITSELLMNIAFSRNILVVGLFLLLSPTAPRRSSVGSVARSLPIIGIGFRALQRRRQSHAPTDVGRVSLIYDGECPMCSNYARILRLRETVGEFVLIDARLGGPVVDEIRQLPHDVNDGMVVKIGDRYFVGHEALHVLALLSEDRGVFSKFNRLAFSSSLTTRLTYPLMRSVRRVLLKLKGVEQISQRS